MGNHQQTLPAIGIYAEINQEGFYRDGSFYYLGRVAGQTYIGALRRFSNHLQEIRTGTWVFKPDQAIKPERWADFVSLLKLAQQENIHLITFLPPLPAQILEVISGLPDRYAYMDQLRAKLAAGQQTSLRFFGPAPFWSSDCEFLDGIHGGEITSLRLLREMGKDPASGLGPYLRHDEIDACIRQYQGKAMVPPAFYPQQGPEVDFLDLGCKKN